MALSFHSERISFDLKQKIKHKQWIRNVIQIHKSVPGNIAFIFTSNEHLRFINREYLNHNYFTDVITFDYSDGNVISGDVFISLEQVKINAEFYSNTAENELKRVMIHGVLHLLGYKDKLDEEKRIMLEKENEALHLWLKMV